MRLLVVRHGETRFNAEHRYLGALDPDLNAKGIAQALDLHAALPMHLDVLICSPLARARQTADLVCKGRGMEPIVDVAFRERHVGVFEGLTQDEARTRFPDLWARNITRVWDEAPIGGESIAAVVDRVTQALRRLAQDHADRTVALVAHGFVAKVIRAASMADYSDFFAWQLPNGAVFEVDLDPDRLA